MVLLAGIFGLVVGALGAWYLVIGRDWLMVDRCLDAGGRWDQSTRLCEDARP